MEIISYNHELEYANLLFSKLFRNIKIQKFYKNTVNYVDVKCVIGNRWRIFKNMENPEKKATYTFPMIVISRRGLQVEPDRIANLHNEIKWQTSLKDKRRYNLMTPVPVAIQYDVTVISKDQATNDMIVSNFIPFFNQDLFVSSLHPKFTNVRFNNQVIMGNSITEEHPEELAGTDDDFVVTTCNFTYKTYLFGGTDKAIAGLNGDGGSGGGGGGGGGEGEGDNIYDGFVPVIKSIMLDIHAVPYKDPLYRENEYISCIVKKARYRPISGDCSVSCNCSVSCECSPSCDCGVERELYYKELSVYMKNGNYDPYMQYTIDKYFSEVDAGMIPPDVDTLRWYIDEGTNRFKLDRYTKYSYDSSALTGDTSGLTGTTSGETGEIDYPGDMWMNGKDPLSGYKNDDLSASEYVPINKTADVSSYIPVEKLPIMKFY